MRKLSRIDLLRLYFRSFLVQTGWSYERMLALGFVWILIPMVKKLCSSVEEQKGFLRRHLLSFNANPYLVSYAIGAVAKLEEEKTPPEQIMRFKDSLQGPLGALGDRLIWQNLMPALLILGIILSMTFGAIGVLSFWLIFNLHQIFIRARGIIQGYALGLDVSSALSRGYLQKAIKWSGRLGAVLLGILFVLKLHQIVGSPMHIGNVLLFLIFIIISVLAFRRNINPGYTFLFSLLIFLLTKALVG